MAKNSILLALKGSEEIKAFSAYLSGLGFDVKPARDGAHALELAVRDVPSLIIAEIDLPVIGGEKVFQILRNNPHTASVPFLFVSDAVTDIKGFKAGVDIFLIKPVKLEELYGRIRQTLSARGGGALSTKEIEGKLSHMSLADILQFLHLNRKEGELKLAANDRTGSIYLKDGQIYNASTAGVEKEKALFRLLQWNDGKFEFIPGAVTAQKKIKDAAGNLLMEGMRQMDEFKKNMDQFPHRDTLIKAKLGSGSLPKNLQPIIYEIIQLSAAYPKVEDLVEHCTYPDYEVYMTLSSMIGRGILEEKEVRAGAGERQEFLTHDQMISIREKIISRFSDIFNLNYGKIFILSTSGRAVNLFIESCGRIPGFSSGGSSSFANIANDNPLGTVARLKLYGGMELLLFSIPEAKHMGPIWKAFSTNLIGLIVLWDDGGANALKELSAAKREILLKRQVPAMHVYAGDGVPAGGEAGFRNELSLKPDEPVFRLNAEDPVAAEVFYGLFSKLIKDDFVAA